MAIRKDVSAIGLEVQKRAIEIKKYANLLRPIFSEIDTTSANEDMAILDSAISQFEKQEFIIVVIGEWSVGKSTFLNAFLGQDVEYLTTDIGETTATVTFLRNASDYPSEKPRHAVITYRDGRKKKDIVMNKDIIADITTALNKGSKVAEEVECVDLYFDGIVIPSKVTIVDTPGLNGLQEHHERITKRQITLAHSAIMLLAATDNAEKKTNLDILRDVVVHASNIIFVVNRYDEVWKLGKDVKDKLLDKVEDLKKKAYGNAKERDNDDVYFLSSKSICDINAGKIDIETEKDISIIDTWADFRDLRGRLYEMCASDRRYKILSQKPISLIKEFIPKYISRIDEKLITTQENYISSEIQKHLDEVEKKDKDVTEMFENIKEEVETDARSLLAETKIEIREFTPRAQRHIEDYIKTHADRKTLLSESFKEEVSSEFIKLREKELSVKSLFESLIAGMFRRWFGESDAIKFSFQKKPIKIDIGAIRHSEARFDGLKTQVIVSLKNIESQIEVYKGNKKELESQINKHRQPEKSPQDMKIKIDQLEANIHDHGQKPAVKVWYTTRKQIIRRPPEGAWEKIRFWNKEYEDERTVSDRHEDDSEAVFWQKKYDQLHGKLEKDKETLSEIIADLNKYKKATKELEGVNEKIEALSHKYKERKSEHEELKDKSIKEQMSGLIAQWSNEIQDTMDHYEEHIKPSVDKLVEDAMTTVKRQWEREIEEIKNDRTQLSKKMQQNNKMIIEEGNRLYEQKQLLLNVQNTLIAL